MAKLTVLGSCGARPEAGRATAGFLLEYEGLRIVLDLGFGTLPRLLEHCPRGDVDAVVITHEHSDHCVDLNALYRVRRYGEYADGARLEWDDRRIQLFCTPGVVDRVEPLEPNGALSNVFDIHELPGTYEIGPLTIAGTLLPHFVPNSGIRITAPGLILSYTGDTGPTDQLVELGSDADLFIVDSSFEGEPDEELSRGSERYLLTAREAGEYAAAANAKRLLLTHFLPGNNREISAARAGAAFQGQESSPGKQSRGTVVVADEGLTLELA
jgi:ribonuclease BN (tRNA processing enzyme)